jgi:tetratricopeptide (TPR) repeat protein
MRAYKAKITVLKKEQRYEEVIKTCKAALKYEPTDYQLSYEEGLADLRLHRYSEAYSCLSQAISLNKKYVRAYVTLGEACCKMNRNDGLELLEKCMAENRDVIRLAELKELRYWVGIFRMKYGQFKEAGEHFKWIVQQKPVNEAAKKRLVDCLEEEGHVFFKRKNFSDALECYGEALQYDPDRLSLYNNAGLAHQKINSLDKAEQLYR